ncbi:MAG: hypothetical protein ACRELV_09935 [Longimicrobiales bacterium]
MPRPTPAQQHLATLTHDGRFWEVYLELEQDAAPDAGARARLAFSPGDSADNEPALRTAVIFIEDTPEAAVARARRLRDHDLLSLLRSCLP